jgi:hypothetical protein
LNAEHNTERVWESDGTMDVLGSIRPPTLRTLRSNSHGTLQYVVGSSRIIAEAERFQPRQPNAMKMTPLCNMPTD